MGIKDDINTCLKLFGLAGLAGITVVAPNGLQGLSLLLKKSHKNLLADHQRVLAELKRQGLVHITRSGEEWHYTLTPAGAKRLQRTLIDEIKIEIPTKWDKKWRVVSFDIPVRYSKERRLFAARLTRFGFAMLQKSVWIHPAPCFEQIEELAVHYNIMRFCCLLEVERMDDITTHKLLKHFATLHT